MTSNWSNDLRIKLHLNQMGKSLTHNTFDTMETERNQNKTKTLWGKDGLLPKDLLVNNYPEMSMMNILYLREDLRSGHSFPHRTSEDNAEKPQS